MKGGQVVILFNLCWYEFQAEPVVKTTGLVHCKLTKRDEEKYQEARRVFKREGAGMWIEPLVKDPPKWTISPWLRQEVGFIVPSDSENNTRQMEWTHVEFGTAFRTSEC